MLLYSHVMYVRLPYEHIFAEYITYNLTAADERFDGTNVHM